MKTLIVYYSFTGNNEALAHNLQERLDCDVIRIRPVAKRSGISILLDLMLKRSPKLERYDIPFSDYRSFVLIAPVWAGKIATPMQTFLKKEKRNILNYAFITLCGGAAGQKEKISAYLSTTLPRKPMAVEELWVSDLLRPEQKDDIRFIGQYRVKEDDWQIFGPKFDAFVPAVTALTDEIHV